MSNKFVNGVIREWYKPSYASFKLNESQDGVPEGMMRVTGIAAVIGVKNRNNRVYTEQNYLYWIDKLQPQIKAGKLFGELEHPESDNINNNNISHKIEALWYEPKTKRVMITLLLLDTEKGKIAQSRIKAGGDICVSSRANGSVNQNGIATIDDLITYDIVGTPGFAESELYLSESLNRDNMVRFKSSNTSECFMFVPNTVHNRISLCEALGNTYITEKNNSFNLKQMGKKKLVAESVQRAKRILESRRAGQLSTNARLTEAQAAQVQHWALNEFAPCLINYLAKAGMIRINESQSKNLMSFGDYANRLIAYNKMHECEVKANECDKVDENDEPDNGSQVLEPEKGLKDQVKAVELKERWERRLYRLNRKIREAEEDKKDAEANNDEEKLAEVEDTLKELEKDRDELEEKIDELEDKIDEAKAGKSSRKNILESKLAKVNARIAEAKEDAKNAVDEDDDDAKAVAEKELKELKDEKSEIEKEIEECEKTLKESAEEDPEIEECDQALTEDELSQLSDDELQAYIEANENAATDSEEPVEVTEEEEPKTPGEMEEAEEAERAAAAADEPTNEDEMEGEKTNEDEEQELTVEEVESPFITEAKRKVQSQSRLVEAIRRRTEKKKLI